MKIAVDIDGTICEDYFGDYKKAKPFENAIAKINLAYEKGHEIWVFTARGSKTGIDWREFTKKQLASWNLRYHKLIFGKPPFDILIDDKSISSINDLKI